MNLRLASILSVSLMASGAFAQTITTTLENEQPTVMSSDGIRLTVFKPFLESRIDSDVPGVGGGTAKGDVEEESYGLSLGYAWLPIRDLGATINASYIDYNTDSDVVFYRADANLGYAFNSKFNVKGGVNVSKGVGSDAIKRLAPGPGVQASVGYQITKNLGLDGGYTVMTQGGNQKGGRFTARENGFEVALSGTF